MLYFLHIWIRNTQDWRFILDFGERFGELNRLNKGVLLLLVISIRPISPYSVKPVHAGEVPTALNALIMRIIEEQETVVDAALSGDYEKAFVAFLNNPNVCLPVEKARELFDRMLENTKAYLPYYDAYVESRKA